MSHDLVLLYSGGVASWCAAQRLVEQGRRPVLLFTDTRAEDEDLYRFLREGARHLGLELVELSEGRDIWQVFKDTRMLGGPFADPCSRILKREQAKRWVAENVAPEGDVALGFDWNETHRLARAVRYWAPRRAIAPLQEPPYLEKDAMFAAVRAAGIAIPRLYTWGLSHNNCGGFCIKSGISHFIRLFNANPDRFAYFEAKELEVQQHLGKPVTVLKDRRGGVTKPMSLAALRERIERGDTTLPKYDIGGCGCFDDATEAILAEPRS